MQAAGLCLDACYLPGARQNGLGPRQYRRVDHTDITTGGADAITVDGIVTITWMNLGDN